MPAYTTPDAIKYPVGTDAVAPLATVLTDMATTTQTAITDVRNDVAASILASEVPPGTITMTARTAAPTGWLLCQGQSVLRAGTYSNLFDAIGTNYGAVDSAHFTIPNLRGKVPVGNDSSITDFNGLNKTGGAKTVTLGINNIPAHTHGTGGDVVPSPVAGYTPMAVAAGGNYGLQYSYTEPSAGGGQAHENMPPYVTVNYMIKY